MSTITNVAATTVRIPLVKPVHIATRTIEARLFTVVRIDCSDGSSGYGFCHNGTVSGSLATAAIREFFKPRLIGEDAHRTEGLWAELYQDTLLNGRAGAVLRALSAVDIALWDRNSRAANLPLWRYLGAFQREKVPAYASGGYYRADGDVGQLASEIESYVDAGFDAVKIKIGAASPSQDAERVRVTRDIIGPDRRLLIDANNAWKDLASALRALEPLMRHDPFFIEEPFAPDDVANHRRLSERLPVALASGELAGARHEHQRLIAEGGITVLQPDVGVCGGITEWRRIAAAAAGTGVSIAPHAFHHTHLHLVASIPNALFVEYFATDATSPFTKLLDTQVEVREGQIVLPTTPGLGFGYDPAALDRYAVDGWA
jgi:L-alanine-DL-glutamate epimerase-like enolase superfamily enzyme